MRLGLFLAMVFPSFAFAYQCPDLTGEYLCAGKIYADRVDIPFGADGEFTVNGKDIIGLGFKFKTLQLRDGTKYSAYKDREFTVPTFDVKEQITSLENGQVSTSVTSCNDESLTVEHTSGDLLIGKSAASQTWRPFRNVKRTTFKLGRKGDLLVFHTEPQFIRLAGVSIEKTKLTQMICQPIPGLFGGNGH